MLVLLLVLIAGLWPVCRAGGEVVPLYEPNDPYYGAGYHWGLDAVRAPQAWDLLLDYSITPITVAVIDSGVDFDHPDLQGRLVDGHVWVPPDPDIIWMYPFEVPEYFDPEDPWDDNEHGTMVSGIIAANTNNDCGISGAGNNWIDIMPLRIMDTSGYGEDYDAADAIIWAADHGADVINMSFGGPASEPSPMEAAVEYAYNKGCVLVAAAGNDGDTDIDIPAAYDDYVLAVGSVGDTLELSDFSDYGPLLDVVAPGENIITTYPNQPIQWIAWFEGAPYNPCTDPYVAELTYGTSFAAPFVAAEAALLLGLYPTLTNAQVYDIIKTSAFDLGDVGRDDTFGWGLVDFEGAVLEAHDVIPEPASVALFATGLLALIARLRRRKLQG